MGLPLGYLDERPGVDLFDWVYDNTLPRKTRDHRRAITASGTAGAGSRRGGAIVQVGRPRMFSGAMSDNCGSAHLTFGIEVAAATTARSTH